MASSDYSSFSNNTDSLAIVGLWNNLTKAVDSKATSYQNKYYVYNASKYREDDVALIRFRWSVEKAN